jgi:hypothetical protein
MNATKGLGTPQECKKNPASRCYSGNGAVPEEVCQIILGNLPTHRHHQVFPGQFPSRPIERSTTHD